MVSGSGNPPGWNLSEARTLLRACLMCTPWFYFSQGTCCQPLSKTRCWIRSSSEPGWLFSCFNLLQTLHCNLGSSFHWIAPVQWSWSIFRSGLLLKIFCSQGKKTLHFEMFTLVTAWQQISKGKKKNKKAANILYWQKNKESLKIRVLNFIDNYF